jgi:alpha-tubulin suppressor-like RCC1 family protein
VWRVQGGWAPARYFMAFVLMTCVFLGVSAVTPPVAVAAVPVASIDVGTDTSCAVTAWGAGYCWGVNSFGAIGDGTALVRSVPVLVSGGQQWKSISVGGNHSCGVTVSGSAYCWGANWNFQLGNGTSTQSSVPVLVSGGVVWKAIETGWDTTCGISTSDDLYCWGKNDVGQVGNGFAFNVGTPWLISGGWKSVATGTQSSCGLKLDSTVWCWGKNHLSQLGNGTTADSLVPVPVSGGFSFNSVGVGKEHACGVRDNQQMYCWGSDGNGSLGNGIAGSQSVPGVVSGPELWKALAVGEHHTCGVTTADQLRCTGYNDYAQLGDGTTTSRQSMVAVAGGGDWRAVSTAFSGTTCGIKTDGQALCWGGNGIGDGSMGVMRLVPTMVLLDVTATTTIEVDVLPFFTFGVAGHVGSCNGVAQTGVSDATSVNLGRVNAANGVAAQTLQVMSNAANGFTVFARSTDPLSSGSADFAPVPGSNAAPTPFPGAGVEAFGYTTSDADLGTGMANRFTAGGAKWAEMTTSDAEVLSGAGAVSSKTACVAFQASAAAATPAGTYQATIVYSAVPSF